ncbi:concanavalin A-like lectin/glucanase domain-containing protein [Rhizophagus clarus]|uniref:Concanavalin A-like lectin/glucanase domain-containing protein n=1 Tax=Rhizophagus clarus TaxID=94130 RepID=A0A8H3M2F4_9GLOM|nr:concanavalin A-like lectin/glucanase domain-containing protein [Rhizophagus clarus]
MSFTENNGFSNLLVEAVMVVPLNDIEFGRLSISAKHVFNDAYKSRSNFGRLIEPLEIISVKMVLNVYREKEKVHKSHLNKIRGINPNCVLDESECGSKLIVEETYTH